MLFLTNSAVLSIFVMILLCLLRFNVFLSIVVASLVAGVVSQIQKLQNWSLDALGANLKTLQDLIVDTMKVMIQGMSGNLETALSYVFLGILAIAISKGNLTKVLIYKISLWINKKTTLFCFLIAFIACFSQNLIPIHIAFIPILIPPLLGVMNLMKLDRRAVACALAFGLEAPYVCIPVGFGLIYHTIIKEQMLKRGIEVSILDIASVMWIGGLAMFVGLVIAIVILYSRPREYDSKQVEEKFEILKDVKLEKKDYLALLSAGIAFFVQVFTSSLPLGSFVGVVSMILFKVIKWESMDKIVEDGVTSMAFIAFIMLVASGFGAVLDSTGGVKELIESIATMVGGKFGGALLMLLVGLLVTMGIGTSFGTLPIIATFYCPLCIELGFGVPATILLLGIAGALGDAGSPAADTTIGPTMGLNADGKHHHIWDTCVPTFIAFNIPLLVFGLVGALILG
ncbi:MULTISPECIES: Na+/H+ antiporter family protein [unclassified Helicobacter]|uniref:Na+/H+ antiporter family protein n=1 Tax=unclassified Helicobacter TaxID=2593540 RepID=UPI000CF17FB2|nr:MULTISPECIES: Na+/H+ antiporter NhaC family protein [unclassified Helicobacter]